MEHIYTVQDIKRFWKHVCIKGPDECWEWTSKSERPTFSFSGGNGSAARFSFLIHTGIWPGRLYVCHSCDNKRCINPSHLWLGTHKDNQRDAAKKGRMARGEDQGSAKLTENDIREIRTKRAAGTKRRQLAKDYRVDETTIDNIVKRKSWKHVR